MRFLAILVLIGSCVLLAGSSLRSQDKEAVKSNYYPLQVGTTWEYKLGEKDRYVMKVTGRSAEDWRQSGDMLAIAEQPG